MSKEMTPAYINAEFDYIVLPMANVFYIQCVPALKRLAEIFQKITVPTYVIACRVQADSFDHLDELIESIKEPASNFIKSIYATGGEFALRGYFTKEFFDRLGFRSAVVTGCPFMYQMGRQLRIEKHLEKGIKSVQRDETDCTWFDKKIGY